MDKQNQNEQTGEFAKEAKIQVNNLFQMCKENKKMVTIIGVFLVVVIGAVFALSIFEKSAETAAAVPVEETSEAAEDVISVPEEALEKDAYPEINNLIKQYYQALVDGDMETINKVKNYTDTQEEIRIVKKSEFIENYPVITVYTKKGPQEGSYVAYVHYEVKFINYEGTAPGLNTLYICTDEEGNYYINANELDEQTVEYLKTVSAQNDVIDLFNTVQVQYNEVKANDEQLSAFLDELPDLLAESVSVAMAELEAQEEANNPVEEEEPEVITVVKTVKTTDVVNVRSSDSIEADKIGKTTKGQVLDLIEERVNGWSKVEFDGKEGFIKSEFLEPEETETIVNTESEDDTDAAAEASNEGETTEDNDTDEVETTKGTLTDTVNVRKTAGTDGEKLGQLSKGSSVDIIEKMSNGWTKIKYNDGEAYVKSDYVE